MAACAISGPPGATTTASQWRSPPVTVRRCRARSRASWPGAREQLAQRIRGQLDVVRVRHEGIRGEQLQRRRDGLRGQVPAADRADAGQRVRRGVADQLLLGRRQRAQVGGQIGVVDAGPVAQCGVPRGGQDVEPDDGPHPPRRERLARHAVAGAHVEDPHARGLPPELCGGGREQRRHAVRGAAAEPPLHDLLVEAGHGVEALVVLDAHPLDLAAATLTSSNSSSKNSPAASVSGCGGNRTAKLTRRRPPRSPPPRRRSARARRRGRSRRSSPGATSPGSGSRSGPARAATPARPAAARRRAAPPPA